MLDKETERKLKKICTQGGEEEIQTLIDTKPPSFPRGRSLFHYCAEKGWSTRIATWEAHVNCIDDHGFSALHSAVGNGHIEEVNRMYHQQYQRYVTCDMLYEVINNDGFSCMHAWAGFNKKWPKWLLKTLEIKHLVQTARHSSGEYPSVFRFMIPTNHFSEEFIFGLICNASEEELFALKTQVDAYDPTKQAIPAWQLFTANIEKADPEFENEWAVTLEMIEKILSAGNYDRCILWKSVLKKLCYNERDPNKIEKYRQMDCAIGHDIIQK
jgi:hypothetical protein